MLILLTAVALLAYGAMSDALLDELDTGLRFRAVAALRDLDVIPAPDPRLQEPTESFEQVLAPDGTVTRATPGFTVRLLTPAEAASVRGPTLTWRSVPHVTGPARVLAVRQGGDVLVVGASGQDRADALATLRRLLLAGGAVALALATLAGWGVATLALRPVERMRAQAAAITESGLDHRLTEPRSRDELARLATTLNQMLDRLDTSISGERSFLEQAGHELRTPLAALRAEVDLALRRERTNEELTAALRSVSAETDRLARLADDLLVLARASDGRLPVHRETISLREALESATALFAARASESGVVLSVTAPEVAIRVDPHRLRQALLNLIDNALRYSPPGSTIRVTATSTGPTVRVAIADSGPGFAPGGATSGSGLGLRIARAIADAHGGSLSVDRAPEGGALVEFTLPCVEPAV
jgi:signal transduction histidine kinase